MKTSIDTRLENERELIALLINHYELMKDLQILPKYMSSSDNETMLKYIIECFKENEIIHPNMIYEKHKDFNIELYVELMTDVYVPNNEIKKTFKLYQDKIVENYKKDIVTTLTVSLANGGITHQDFIEKIKKLDSIKIDTSSAKTMLNIKDIDYKSIEKIEYIKSNSVMLDKQIKGFALGQLSVWSGGNASAKSTYLNQVAIESIQQGYKVAIYSGELTSKRILNWIIMQCAGFKNMKLNFEGQYYYVENSIKDKICNWLDGKMFIYDNQSGNKAQTIIESIKGIIKEKNVKVVILDNLMSMDLSSYGDNKYDVQSNLIQELSALAKEYNVHVHFVCHPRKVTNFLRKIDISGSADLTNIADNVFIMHRVNEDFRMKTREMFGWKEDNPMYSFTNVIEVCKNRELGVEDQFAGLYFEKESKRLKNSQSECKMYDWEKKCIDK